MPPRGLIFRFRWPRISRDRSSIVRQLGRRPRGTSYRHRGFFILSIYYKEDTAMTGREVIKENEAVLRGIVRSIDKNLDYSTAEGSQADAPRFTIQLSMRGRRAVVSLSLEDLIAAAQDVVRKNALRQKIKSVHDHMMDTHVVDVMGNKTARMLKESAATQETFQRPNFNRGRGPRR